MRTRAHNNRGVGRQYTGTSGKIDNCQIRVFAAYATSRGRALMDRELYLPKAWTSDRERCRAAKIPDERQFATKGELAKAIVTRSLAAGLPAHWVTADEAYGQEWKFRRLLEELGVGYVMAVPKSQQVKSLAGFWRIDELISQAPQEAWQRLSCGDGAKGPRVYDWASAKLSAISSFDGGAPTHHRWVLARRNLTRPNEIAYYFAYAPVARTVADLARVAGMRWAIEECFQAAKNECGLDEYEVRRYVGWYRHITLAMLVAHAFLAGLAADEAVEGLQTTPPASSPSPWQRSAGSWNICCPSQNPARSSRSRTELVPLATTSTSHRLPLPLPENNRFRTRSAAGVLGPV
ncbi:IS701 family transposase [Streptomyces vietnamensis]